MCSNTTIEAVAVTAGGDETMQRSKTYIPRTSAKIQLFINHEHIAEVMRARRLASTGEDFRVAA